MNNLMKFIVDNFKILMVVFGFMITQYIQNMNNTAEINELKKNQAAYDLKLDEQYKKIDAIKLDKAVFEATTDKISSISDDMKEMRSDIKELLKNKR